MFEGIVASLMNMYLSEYIDEVDYNNLKIGIFSGKLVLFLFHCKFNFYNDEKILGTLELLNVKVKPSALVNDCLIFFLIHII
jgi:hypothetical protein